MVYTIYLADQSGSDMVKLPVLPSELPEVSFSVDTEDFVSVKGGHYTIIGKSAQPTISAEHLLPEKGKELSFSVSDTTGKKVINILKDATSNSKPVQYVIAQDDGKYYINRLFAVTSYSYHIDRKNDYIVSFSLTGWKEYKGWKSATSKKISITPTKVTIKKGKTKQAKLKNVSKKAKVTWKTSKASVATVSSKGVISAKKKGKATISATYKKKTYKCEVSVK